MTDMPSFTLVVCPGGVGQQDEGVKSLDGAYGLVVGPNAVEAQGLDKPEIFPR